jgi:Transcriptional activator of glycolytic enzymes
MTTSKDKKIFLKFMKFRDGNTYSLDYEFGYDQLRLITAVDICRWFRLLAYGSPEPPSPHQLPNGCRARTLYDYKSIISSYIPNNTLEYNVLTKIGNPTLAPTVLDLIKRVENQEYQIEEEKRNKKLSPPKPNPVNNTNPNSTNIVGVRQHEETPIITEGKDLQSPTPAEKSAARKRKKTPVKKKSPIVESNVQSPTAVAVAVAAATRQPKKAVKKNKNKSPATIAKVPVPASVPIPPSTMMKYQSVSYGPNRTIPVVPVPIYNDRIPDITPILDQYRELSNQNTEILISLQLQHEELSKEFEQLKRAVERFTPNIVIDDVVVSATVGSKNATLSKCPKNLYVLWEEYQKGLDGRKPAKRFSLRERGKVRYKYTRRKVVWDRIRRMKKQGFTAKTAIQELYRLYGETTSVTDIINKIRTERMKSETYNNKKWKAVPNELNEEEEEDVPSQEEEEDDDDDDDEPMEEEEPEHPTDHNTGDATVPTQQEEEDEKMEDMSELPTTDTRDTSIPTEARNESMTSD